MVRERSRVQSPPAAPLTLGIIRVFSARFATLKGNCAGTWAWSAPHYGTVMAHAFAGRFWPRERPASTAAMDSKAPPGHRKAVTGAPARAYCSCYVLVAIIQPWATPSPPESAQQRPCGPRWRAGPAGASPWNAGGPGVPPAAPMALPSFAGPIRVVPFTRPCPGCAATGVDDRRRR